MSLRLKELMASMELEGKVAKRSEYEAEQWQKILLRWPQVVDVEANFRICQGACHPLDLTLDNVSLLLENDESFIRQLVIAEPEAIKRDLIEKIAECLDPDEGDFAIKNRKKTLSFYTLERLREELRNAQARENLRDKPAAELRQIVRAGRSVPGLPELPPKIVIHGETVKLDASRIKSLDRDSLKTLIRKWGADAVNARLRGE